MLSEACIEFSKYSAEDNLANAQKYAHDIIGNLNEGMSVFLDWNLVLDELGGPNHVKNFCDAPISVQKRDKAEVEAEAMALLDKMGLQGKENAYPYQLSGGQRRRVEIARALLCPGGAVILDEPFTGLDIAARDACTEVVLDLLDGRMLLLATHDSADARALNISDIITL